MEKPNPRPSAPGKGATGNYGAWALALIIGSLFVVLLSMLLPRHTASHSASNSANAPSQSTVASGPSASAHRPHISRGFLGASGFTQSPEEIVAGKVTQFAQSRLKIAHAMAERYKVSVAPDVERFFEAVAAGRWDELNAHFKALMERRKSANGQDLQTLWGPILETLLIAECAHNWPAQQLLDYAQATLGSLQPGMVYVGGTDPGRGIPTLLNATSDGEQHIVITQNGLADNSYLQYLDFLYGDRVTSLTPQDSQQAFQDYIADAQKRLAHDQQFPDDPKQIRPGESITVDADGHVQISGQVAVMGINEKLLTAFMTKNPDLSFGLEESFPLKSTYANAVPLGPLMQLGVQDVQNTFTSDTAAQVVNYWNNTAQQLFAEPDTSADSLVSLTYSKMAAAQASLLAEHNFNAQAEQAYRTALQICPFNPEAVYGLGQLLASTGRADEARQLIANFQRDYPNLNKGPAPPVWTATAAAAPPHP
jgi:hypothetical protein